MVNFETMRLEAAEELVLNAVGNVTVHFDRALVFDPYRDNPETGAFILIDRVSLDTVGIGLLL